MKKPLIVLVVAIGVLSGSYWLFRSYHEETVSVLGYGTIEAREIRLGTSLGGLVAQVHVREGDFVKTGQDLITMDSRELEAQQAESYASRKAAEARLKEMQLGYRKEDIEKTVAIVEEQSQYLKKLEAGPRQEEVEASEAFMKAARADLAFAIANHARALQLFQQGVEAQQLMEDARRALETSRERFRGEEKNYAALQAGSRQEDIAIARARLAQAKAELSKLQAGYPTEEIKRAQAFVEECHARSRRIEIQLKDRTIKATIEALVEVCDLEPGDILPPGKVVVNLLKPKDLWVKIYIKEREFHRIKLGQSVVVALETKEAKTFRSVALRWMYTMVAPQLRPEKYAGKIVHLASAAEFTPRNVQTTEERGNQVFAVKVAVENPDEFLRPGISVIVEEK